MVLLAFLFVVTGVGVAVAGNVARRALVARSPLAAVTVVASVVAAAATWTTSVVSIAATAIAFVAALVVFRFEGARHAEARRDARDDEANERLQGALLGLAVFHGIVLVAGALGVYFMRGDAM